MSSINTNLSSMSALQSLRNTQRELATTQERISSGLRVGEASHNASGFSIGTKMKSDVTSLGAVKDAIGQSTAMIDTFSSALGKSLEYLNKMKTNILTAMQPGADRAAIQEEYKGHIEGLKSISNSASINGQSWLKGTGDDVNLVTSYDGNSKTVGRLEIDTSQTTLFADPEGADAATAGGLLGNVAFITLTDTDTDTILDGYLTQIDTAISAVTKGAAMLGANKALLETQSSFIDVMSDSLKGGVSTILDADMNEESTRLQALQTKQQLGVQSLSIANQNSQMILQLFQ